MPYEEHKDFPISDWRYEVANGDTMLGYMEWVEHKVEEKSYDEEK